jgi:hypothetical protein
MDTQDQIEEGSAVIVAEPTPPARPPAVQTDGATALLALIERAAGNPDIDIDKMERLFSMRRQLTADEAEQRFNEAMAKAQAELRPIEKKAYNEHTKSHYALMEDVHAEVMPIITKHGFSVSFDTDEPRLEGHYCMVLILSNGGFTRRYRADLPADLAGAKGNSNKTAIQGFGSTMTYGRRYMTLNAFNVAVRGMDNDGNRVSRRDQGGPPISEAEAAELRELIAKLGTEESLFVEHMREIERVPIQALAELPANKFGRARGVLQAFIKRQGQATGGGQAEGAGQGAAKGEKPATQRREPERKAATSDPRWLEAIDRFAKGIAAQQTLDDCDMMLRAAEDDKDMPAGVLKVLTGLHAARCAELGGPAAGEPEHDDRPPFVKDDQQFCADLLASIAAPEDGPRVWEKIAGRIAERKTKAATSKALASSYDRIMDRVQNAAAQRERKGR